MKRTSLALITLAFSASVAAEWVKVGKNEDMDVYFDPATIRKVGDMRRVWELQDFRARKSFGELSMRTQVAYDCKNQTHKPLSISIHSENMAAGKVLFSDDVSTTWKDIAPKTTADIILKAACLK